MTYNNYREEERIFNQVWDILQSEYWPYESLANQVEDLVGIGRRDVTDEVREKLDGFLATPRTPDYISSRDLISDYDIERAQQAYIEDWQMGSPSDQAELLSWYLEENMLYKKWENEPITPNLLKPHFQAYPYGKYSLSRSRFFETMLDFQVTDIAESLMDELTQRPRWEIRGYY